MEPTRSEFLFQDNPAAKVAFYALTFLSIGIMIAQFILMSKRWNQGQKPTWRFPGWSGIAEYILSQRKVKSSRPRDGAPMHLAIFYGFLGLFVATSLLGLATYSPLIGLPNWHRGNYYLAYEAIFDAVGLVFTIGVAWALGRRISLMRKFGAPVPDAEGKLSVSKNPLTTEAKDFFALVVLLMLGVTGFVVEAIRINLVPNPGNSFSFVGAFVAKFLPELPKEAYVGIWWFHAIWVWLFFVTLPSLRLKHIVVATMTAAKNPDWPMGQLQPVTMEQVEASGTIGVVKATDYSQWHLMSLDACMSCGRCTEVCPANGVGKTLNPKQVVQDVHRALIVGDDVPARVSEEALWACTTCHACVEACPVLIRHVDLIVDARRNLVAEGKLAGSSATLLRQIGSTSHAWGQQSNSREDWMKGLNIPLARDGVEFDILFWVGCAGATDPAAIRTTRAFAQLLQRAGVKFACLGREEACTGDPARRIGDEFTFQDQVSKNHSAFAKYGITKVVTACPHCLNSLANEYLQFGPTLEVWHHTQLLDQLVQQGKLKPISTSAKFTYHDPCYLARVNGISDAPRRLFGEESDLEGTNAIEREWTSPITPLRVIHEPKHHGSKTLCCGAGGGRMWAEEPVNQRPSDRRVDELLETGADQVVVSCPFCRIMLDTGIQQKSPQTQLVDIAELMAESNA